MSSSMLSEMLQRALARFGLVGLYETDMPDKTVFRGYLRLSEAYLERGIKSQKKPL